MHCEHNPQCGFSFEVSQVCAQLREVLIIGAQPDVIIRRITSPLVSFQNGLSTMKSWPASSEKRCRIAASTRGCVVRVARLPTTCAHTGRFRLTTPFS